MYMYRHHTGPGSDLGENFLSEVSISGATTIPGDDIPALSTTSSQNIDWKKPINNGIQFIQCLSHTS